MCNEFLLSTVYFGVLNVESAVVKQLFTYVIR